MSLRSLLLLSVFASPLLLAGCALPGYVYLGSDVCNKSGAPVVYGPPGPDGKIDSGRYSPDYCKH